MSDLRSSLRLGSMLLGLALLPACNQPLTRDYYSEAKVVCPEALALTGYDNWIQEGELFATLKLPDECVEALESMVDWDDSFFVDPAPELYLHRASLARKKMIDSLYVLLAYPLVLPTDPHELHVLGVGHAVFPGSLLCAVAPDHFRADCPGFSHDDVAYAENLNQAFFNYLMPRLGHLIRIPKITDSYNAQAKTTPKTLITEDLLRDTPFYRVSTLLHEARHHDGIYHVLCDEIALVDGRGCDADMSGPQSMQLLYGEALLHGSAQVSQGEGYLMDLNHIWEVANAICGDLLAVNHVPPALDDFRREYLIQEDSKTTCKLEALAPVLRVFDPSMIRE